MRLPAHVLLGDATQALEELLFKVAHPLDECFAARRGSHVAVRRESRLDVLHVGHCSVLPSQRKPLMPGATHSRAEGSDQPVAGLTMGVIILPRRAAASPVWSLSPGMADAVASPAGAGFSPHWPGSRIRLGTAHRRVGAPRPLRCRWR